MKRGLSGVAALSLVCMLGANAAGAAPPPGYSITCVVGGQTTVTWRHAKLVAATLEWFAGSATQPYVATSVPLAAKAPHGFIVTSAGVVTGFVPARVRASFQHAGGAATIDHVEAVCA
jgi:hypothetical protein